jgi:hypothetical protein
MTEIACLFIGATVGVVVSAVCFSWGKQTLEEELRVARASVDYYQGVVRQYEACVDEPEEESARLVTIQ